MRKIILNLAISLDGYIADIEGGFEWIKGDGDSSNDTEKVFGFQAFSESIGTVVMGSEAYRDCGITDIIDYQDKQFYVASREHFNVEENVKIFSGDLCSQILDLRKEEGKNIWLFGGGGLVTPFIEANIIDEYIIGIIPIILGKGRKLFLGTHERIELKLVESTVSDGIPILVYSKRK